MSQKNVIQPDPLALQVGAYYLALVKGGMPEAIAGQLAAQWQGAQLQRGADEHRARLGSDPGYQLGGRPYYGRLGG